MVMYYNITTLGCQMNKSDSERVASFLDSLGWVQAENEEEADFLLVNTCSVRQSAEDRVYGLVRKWTKWRKKKPNLIIGVTGCMAGRDKDDRLKKKMKEVDLFFRISDLLELGGMLEGLVYNEPPQPFGQLPLRGGAIQSDLKDYLNIIPSYDDKFQAYVPIQTGCNQFCTYCVVPYARGREVNRPVKDILDEIKKLADSGCVFITLLGQIVNNYNPSDDENFSKENLYKKSGFAKLLWEINQIDGIEKIHFTAPHPLYMDDEVIDALLLSKQVNFLHLPVQSGSDEILQKMNRKHDRDFYIDLIKKIRDKKPGITIGTDIIVGFPGETEKDFEDTIDLYKKCDFDISYHAKYSIRPSTVAAKAFVDDVSLEEKKRRWECLQKLMEDITLTKNLQYKDKVVEVLVDKYENGICEGQSNEMKLTSFPGDVVFVGQIVKVKITSPKRWILEGEMV